MTDSIDQSDQPQKVEPEAEQGKTTAELYEEITGKPSPDPSRNGAGAFVAQKNQE